VGAKWSADEYAAAQQEVAGLDADDDSLESERIRGAVLSHRDWLKADAERARLRVQWRPVFDSWDVVICPVSPTPAYPHDQTANVRARKLLVDGQPYPYFDQFAWCSVATLVGLPATAFPIGITARGLPLGAQAIGSWNEDHTTLKFAALLEREFGGFVRPPGF